MLIPLWPERSTSQFSDILNIAPGKVCVLYASGMQAERCRVSDDEFKVPQSVCVRKIVHSVDTALVHRSTWCDWVVTPKNVLAVVDDIVETDGNCWELTLSNNLRIIGVPGTYRLELNDCTAIGVVQVYADLYNVEQLPHQISHLFF